MSRESSEGSGRFPHPRSQEVRFSSVQEQEPRLWSLEEIGVAGVAGQDTGWRAAARGHSRLLMILLRMVCSSLTLISRSWGTREDGICPRQGLPFDAPEAPLHHTPTYLPCQLSEEGLEVLINLLFREHLLDGEGGAGQGRPSLAPAWAAARGRAGTTQQLQHVTSPL